MTTDFFQYASDFDTLMKPARKLIVAVVVPNAGATVVIPTGPVISNVEDLRHPYESKSSGDVDPSNKQLWQAALASFAAASLPA